MSTPFSKVSGGVAGGPFVPETETRKRKFERVSGGVSARPIKRERTAAENTVEVVDKYIGGPENLTGEQKLFFQPIKNKDGFYSFGKTGLTYVKLLDEYIRRRASLYVLKKINETDKLVLADMIGIRDDGGIENTIGFFDDKNKVKAQALINTLELNRKWALRFYAMSDVMFGLTAHKAFPDRITTGKPGLLNIKKAKGGPAGLFLDVVPLFMALLGFGARAQQFRGGAATPTPQTSPALPGEPINPPLIAPSSGTSLSRRVLSIASKARRVAKLAAKGAGLLGESKGTRERRLRLEAIERQRIVEQPLLLNPFDLWFMTLINPNFINDRRIRVTPQNLQLLPTVTLNRPVRVGNQQLTPQQGGPAALAAIYSTRRFNINNTLRAVADSLSSPDSAPSSSASLYENLKSKLNAAGASLFNVRGGGLKKGGKGINKGLMVGALLAHMLNGGVTGVNINGVVDPGQINVSTPFGVPFGAPSAESIIEGFGFEEVKFDPLTGEPRIAPQDQAVVNAAMVTIAGLAAIAVQQIPIQPPAVVQPPTVVQPPGQQVPVFQPPVQPLLPETPVGVGTGVGTGIAAGVPGQPSGGDPGEEPPEPGGDGGFAPVPPPIKFPKIPCLDLIAIFIIRQAAKADEVLRAREDEKKRRAKIKFPEQPEITAADKLDEFLVDVFKKDRGPEMNKCFLGTVYKSSDVRERALEIIKRVGSGDPFPISPISPTDPAVIPIGSQIPGTPITPGGEIGLQTEIQRLLACIKQKPQGKEFLLAVSSLQNTPPGLRVSYLKAFCGI